MAKLLCTTAAAALVTLALGDAEPTYPSAEAYTVGGACVPDDNNGIDGLTFVKHGVTRNGSPYYKATTSLKGEKYLYYDLDCQGGAGEPKRWIFDTNRPDVTKENDLDNDLACDYIASADSTDASHPPSGKWRLLCDGVEEEHFLTLKEGRASVYTPPMTGGVGNRGVAWEGACALKSFLNGKVFEEIGATADGRPFFKAQGREEYIYYDADCDGRGSTTSARWVLDNGRPSTTAAFDLDADNQCDYHARLDGDSQRPPAYGNWRMFCGAAEGWVNVPVTLRETPLRSTHTVNSAHKRGVLAVAAVALAAACTAALGF